MGDSEIESNWETLLIEEAKAIALDVYPEDWIESTAPRMRQFRYDNNHARRRVAERVALHVLKILRSDKTAELIMKGFYRRQTDSEPPEDLVPLLTAYMSTALRACEFHGSCDDGD